VAVEEDNYLNDDRMLDSDSNPNMNNLEQSEIETLMNEIPEDENDNTIMNKLKKYIKIILILVLLFIIINNKHVLKLLQNYLGDNLFPGKDDLIIPSTTGILIQGGIFGVSYILISTLLHYLGII